jgi:HEPN domain
MPKIKPTSENILRVARGFLDTARELEATHRRETAPPPKGTTIDSAWLDRAQGRIVSATILEALAVELALKARLTHAHVEPPNTHDHLELFKELPSEIRDEADREYQSRRHPAMRKTLAEALAFSAKVFVDWRYAYEHPSVQASGGEMFHAFAALTAGF